MAEDQKYSLDLQFEEEAVYADRSAWIAIIVIGALIVIGVILFIAFNRKNILTSLDRQLDLSGDVLVALSATGEKGEYNSVQEKTIHIFRKDSQGWSLEQEIALVDFLSAPEDHDWDLMSVIVDLDDDTLALAVENDLSTSSRRLRDEDDLYRIYIFRHDGSAWQLEREISKSSPIEDFNSAVDSRIYDINALTLDNNRLAVSADGFRTEGGIHVFKRDDSTWILEQSIPKADTEGEFGTAFRVRNMLLDDDTLVVHADNWSDDTWGRIQIFRRDGLQWSLEQTVSDAEPIEGLDIKKLLSRSSDYFVELVGLSNNRLAILTSDQSAYGKSVQVIYILRRDDSGWVLEKGISNEQSDEEPETSGENWSNKFFFSVVFNDDRLVIETFDGAQGILSVVRRQDADWVLEQEISIREIAAAGNYNPLQFSSIEVVALDSETLAVHVVHLSTERAPGRNKGVVYILRRRNGKWQSEEVLPFSDIVNGWLDSDPF